MINQATKTMFTQILIHGELRYSDCIRVREDARGIPTRHTNGRVRGVGGNYVAGMRHHLSVGNLTVRRDGQKSFYSLTEKGKSYLK